MFATASEVTTEGGIEMRLLLLLLLTVDTVVHNSCVLFAQHYALYPVIRLYCGLILLEYARFFSFFFHCICV